MNVRFVSRILALVTMAACCGQVSAAEETPKPPPYQLNRADEDNRYLCQPSRRADFWDSVKCISMDATGAWYLSLGGEARERYEYFNNPSWGKDLRDHGYFLQRYFLHADIRMGEHARLFTQLQSSLEDGRAGGPRPSDRDDLDLHQAFLEVRFGVGDDAALTLRSGRQELYYGSQRIISVREGPNVRQSFDGFRGMLHLGEFRLDGFVTRPAETKRHLFDDGPDNDRALWGVYAVSPVPALAKGNVDLYYAGFSSRNARFDQGAARETRHSAGARLWRTASPLDYNFEAIYQWGRFGDGEIRAWTVASDTGYTFEALPLMPRLGIKANIATGDEDPGNPDLQTFNPLFPKGSYFSENNLIGPANFFNLDPSLTLLLTYRLTFAVDWNFFWRESTRDGVYNNAVVLVRTGKSSDARYVGNQSQVQLTWNPDRHLSLTAIYAHFFAGPFIKETGPGKDVDYVTTWLTYRF
jgi:alginate export protein